MKFGKVDHPEHVDFALPHDHPGTKVILENTTADQRLTVYVGCAKWNRQDLKGFYPRGTKDELAYYATQFNSIELNATFYRMFDSEQIKNWRDKTPADFKFFPKITQSISHMRRLNNVEQLTEAYCDNIVHFEEKLGMVFLQLHNNFGYKNFDRLASFVEKFPKAIPLATEVRHHEWFDDEKASRAYYDLLEKHHVTNILVDTAGRRDLLHMRLTTPTAFVRFVGANHPDSEYKRLDDWVDRLEHWVGLGLKNIYFFVHQNLEKESPTLSAYFINKINERLGTNLKPPTLPNASGSLF
ncbi:DUF72 domain-containing protein [Sunxiuqinia dokdonensis]|uniref:DUF72 domain-containing protein n=1 Tax=Sunxiuqinia dokdonensis TaxID=1409788 RepID=A0A0L8V779_9BACT|nr:DUF72 domain-containing protein [Sunxiuqinia dokdonensis]KOH44193.1 hypothetical protein NC99_29990 [Sunxiuqinia dokdonensis]